MTQRDLLHGDHVAESAEQVAIQDVQGAILSSAHERMGDGIARRQIREQRRSARTEVSVVRVEGRLIGGREILIDPERGGQLKQRIPVVVVCGVTLLASKFPLPVETYTLPLESTAGASPAIHTPPSRVLGVVLNAALCV